MLVERSGCKCGVCLTEYEARYFRLTIGFPMRLAGEGGGSACPTNSN